MSIDTLWQNYGSEISSIEYPDCSMAQLVFDAALTYPNVIAYDFFGSKQSYRDFADEIHLCANALRMIGIGKHDRVTICMPNTPQAVVMFYALNHIGAVANMVHPLSASEELVRYLNDSRSVATLTLDQFSDKLIEILPRTGVNTLILCGIEDGLKGIKKPLYRLTQGRKIPRRPSSGKILRYSEMLAKANSKKVETFEETSGDDIAAILYSGGTTGTTKGILLTNRNFNALALQTISAAKCVVPTHKMLAIMPIFHGFGLGICIHTAYVAGGTTILVPQFSIKSYAQLLKKYKPHYIAGVPTLFEALLRLENIDKLDMSQLEGVFCGGDSLSVELKRKVDAFLIARGAKVQVREGYGLTECVTASCLTPHDFHKEGSIGIPYPDTFYKIVRQGSTEALPYGEEGEITLTGPTVMKGYDNNEEETSQALQLHSDGLVWLHTGDLGVIDEEGFVYFRQRIKRMIVTSGYSVYPSQLENEIEAHESVLICCVIGVPDDYRMQRIKAFIVLREGLSPTDEIKASILEHCSRHIARYAMPREFEYRDELPRTLVGKVAYTILEEEEAIKIRS
ncbi:MAG: AMP-binding protein [Oscillospiraceae bacterium]|nr:AMP-binding protein [Oscillospiraceae bacterium]